MSDDLREEGRVGCQIMEVIAGGPMLLIDFPKQRAQFLVSASS